MSALPETVNAPPGRFDLAERVTQRIIAKLESVKPGDWRCPWTTNGNGNLPINGFTGKAYTGTNTILFWLEADMRGYSSHRWMTFKQMRMLGGRLSDETLARPKGTKDTLGVRYGSYEKKVPRWVDKQGNPRDTDEVSYAKAFYVFNVDQIIGLPDRLYEAKKQEYGESTRAAIRDFVIKSGVNLSYGGSRAYYQPISDRVQMPFLSQFIEASGEEGPEHHDSTLLHEIVHWSGHPERLNREDLYLGDAKAYAREELTAEFGASILCAYFGVQGRLQHEEYIAGWIQHLKTDPKALFNATRNARHAFEFLLERGGLPSPDEEPTAACVAADLPSGYRDGSRAMEKREVMKFKNEGM